VKGKNMKTQLWKNIPKNGAVVVVGLLLGIAAAAWAQTPNTQEPQATAATNEVQVEAAAPAQVATGETKTAKSEHGIINLGRSRASASGEPIVAFGQHVELKADETAEAVVVFGGTAKIEGKVTDAVVVIGGAVEISGEVGDAVAVGGSIHAVKGANIRGDAVAVAGGLILDEGAKLKGDAVVVFGQQTISDPAGVGGEMIKVLAADIPFVKPLKDFFVECVLKLRPLAPSVGWVWGFAGAFFLLYAVVALALPRPVELCVEEITKRPLTTFLMGLLTKILLPVIMLVLTATGIGVFVVPFLLLALVFAAIIGKVALLEYLGKQITRHFGGTQQPLLAFVVGWLIITVLYIIPVLGLLVFAVTGVWALGAAVMATFGGARREIPPRNSAPAQPPSQTGDTPAADGFAPMPMPATGQAPTPTAFGSSSADVLAVGMPVEAAAFAGTPPGIAPQSPPVSVPPEALSFPRAGFWERMGAAFLDVILVSIASGIAGAMVGGPIWFFLIALAYFAGMWTWKGTTIGCIVLKLKVVRLDGGPMTFQVALIRGLAAAFGMCVFFLGFLWIAWDPEKQGWHDKIAGTTVVRLPRTQALVCF
jgi:uncharacterized RDD family membrane protein YckC